MIHSRTRAFLLVFVLCPTLAAQLWPRKEVDGEQEARDHWFYDQRAYPAGSIPAGARWNALRAMERIDAAARQRHQASARAAVPGGSLGITLDAANWTLIGPMPTGGGSTYVTAGRVNAIAIDPRDNNTVYIGAAEGGVWKTTDGGATWTPLTDSQASLASGAIVIDPNNPNTVYVGTGEENFAQDSYYGAGILKSTDAGATWTNIPGPFLPTRDHIGAIAIEPGSSNVLLCTSTNGVFRSTDAGQTWINVLTGVGISVVFDPTNGSSAYVTLGNYAGSSRNGVYHSADGGITWTLSTGSGASVLPAASAMGRIEIAMAPSNPAILYAQVESIATATNGGLLGIWKTTDGGQTWNKLPISASLISSWGTQLWYDNAIRVSPIDPDVVWAGALQLYRSLDGGNTWTVLPQTGPNSTVIHVDEHFFAFTPDGTKLYIANDGGVYSTTDVTNTRVNWTALNNTLAVTQFYPGMSIDPGNAENAVGGTQDNGTQEFNGDVNWSNVSCGDGGFTALDPAFPTLLYAACQFISIERTIGLPGGSTYIGATYGINTSDSSQFISPLVMDPANPQTLYFGTYRVWQTQDSAGRWSAVSPDLTGGKKGTLKTIAVAPSDSDTVYIGTNNSKVQVTRDMNDGENAAWVDRSASLPPRTITHIAVDPVDAATAYVAFSGFSGVSDTLGHLFKTTNAGATWIDNSGNLPNIPLNDVVVDPDLPQTLYVASDIGVMVTTDGGLTWSTLGSGLPRAAVFSLVLQRKSRLLRAATHGRSVWDILVPLGGTASIQPAITAIAPTSANPGGGAFQLSITGSNLTSSTVVRWNGQARPTTFVDSSHLTVAIPATDIGAVGRASIAAFNPAPGGGSSNSILFIIGSGPQSTAKSAVSAANPTGGNNLSVRSIASVYGVNLAPTTQVADLAPPLPGSLGGTALSMLNGSQFIPVFFVSPTQINFQVPFITTGAQQLTITQGTQSITIPVTLVNYAPALFSTNAQGTGQASVTIANTSTVAAPVGTFPGSRPAQIGEYISIYCTGLGPSNNQPGLGSASPSNPLATTQAQPTVTIGGVSAPVIFSGLAPGYVGLYQVNAQVPATAPTGVAVPIVLTIGGVTSNIVTIAVDPAQ
jgi:uncharacterized protein (TIGR03437 family)